MSTRTPLLKNWAIETNPPCKAAINRGKPWPSNAICSENVRTSIDVSIAVLEGGKGEKSLSFLHGCTREGGEGKSKDTVC